MKFAISQVQPNSQIHLLCCPNKDLDSSQDEVELKLRLIWSVTGQFETFQSMEMTIDQSPAKLVQEKNQLEALVDKCQKSLQRIGGDLKFESQDSDKVTKVTLLLKLGLYD